MTFCFITDMSFRGAVIVSTHDNVMDTNIYLEKNKMILKTDLTYTPIPCDEGNFTPPIFNDSLLRMANHQMLH